MKYNSFVFKEFLDNERICSDEAISNSTDKPSSDQTDATTIASSSADSMKQHKSSSLNSFRQVVVDHCASLAKLVEPELKQGIVVENQNTVEVLAMKRPSWKGRGKSFSDLGVLLECGKSDLTITKNVLHYVTTGTARFMFAYNKELFFVPVVMILKCLKNVTDSEIFRELMVGSGDDPYRRGVIVNMLRELQVSLKYFCV